MSRIDDDYGQGYRLGVEWAEFDIKQGRGITHEWEATFREEAAAGTGWARSFYLGALRGYRSVVRNPGDRHDVHLTVIEGGVK